MIKFRMYSSGSGSKMGELVNKLSSVALGNFIFDEVDNGIICKVTDDVNTYSLRSLVMDDNNVLEVNRYRNIGPRTEPTKSYAIAMSELIDSLEGKGYSEAIDFINKLSKKKEYDKV